MKQETKGGSKAMKAKKAMKAAKSMKVIKTAPKKKLEESDVKKLVFPGTKKCSPKTVAGCIIYTEAHRSRWRIVLKKVLERSFGWKHDQRDAWARLITAIKNWVEHGKI